LTILIQILPNPPDNILKDIQSTFYQFLWNGKKDKVKREILTNSYEDGGLKMIDIKLFCQALKLTWIKKYIDSLNFSPWKILFIENASDLITVIFPINVKSRQHQALSILLIR
jgi:hypothetical protein